MLRHSVRRVGFVAALGMLVWGAGLMLRAEPPQDVGTWASIGAVPENRVGAAVAMPDGRTIIAGGLANGVPTDALVLFDPTDGSFTSVGQLLEPRAGHTATLLDEGRILIAGGTVNNLLSGDLEILDLSTGTSTLVATMTQLRSGHAAARLDDGTVLIAGGTGTDDVLASAELFDPATGGVALTQSPLLSARTGASATTMIDGRVLIAGGNNGTEDLVTAEIYNPSTQSFQATDTNLAMPRSNHTAVLLPHNNSVLIAGGSSNGVPQASADLFLPAQFPDPYSYGMGQFAPTGAMGAPRSGAAGGPHVEGYAFVAGGGATDAEVYRFATIKTDKGDYAPGELAVISGSGWQPNEEVTLLFQEDPAVHADYVLTVTADAEGNIYHDQWAPEQHDLGVRFYLMAMGEQSGQRAQTTFTDGNRVRFSTNGAATNIFPLALSSVVADQCVALYVQEQQGSMASLAPSGGRAVNLSSTPSGATFYSTTDCTGGSITSITIPALSFSIQFSFRISTASATPYTIAGDSSFTGDNDASATITITGPSNVATTTSINAPTITYGENGVVTVTVNPNSGSSTPTGNVSLSVDGGTAVTRALSGGSYTFTAADVPELTAPSAGSHSLSASYAGDTGFNASGPTAGTLTVNPKAVEVTASSHVVTYGDATPTITASYDGFVLGDDESVLTTTPTCTTAYGQGDPVSGSPYPTSCSGAMADNYTFTYVDGEVAVNKKTVEVTASSHTITYGDPAPTITPIYDGFVLGENASVLTTAPTCTTTYDQGDPVSGSPYPTSCSGAMADNYTFTYVEGAVVVDKAVLTVTAKSANRPFGTPNPDLSAPLSITGFVLGEGPSVLIAAPTCATTAVLNSPVGQYPVTCSGGMAANYSFTYVDGTLTITAWYLTGFYQPVGIPNSIHTAPGALLPATAVVWNTIKGGQTVPLKFEIFESMGGTERTSVSDVQGFGLASVACYGAPIEDVVDFTTTGGTSLRYDSLDGQFIQNWQSPKGAGKCYRATMTAADGSSISTFFKTK